MKGRRAFTYEGWPTRFVGPRQTARRFLVIVGRSVVRPRSVEIREVRTDFAGGARMETHTVPELDVAAVMGGLYGDGIIGLKGAFAASWADRLHDDVMGLLEESLQVP